MKEKIQPKRTMPDTEGEIRNRRRRILDAQVGQGRILKANIAETYAEAALEGVKDEGFWVEGIKTRRGHVTLYYPHGATKLVSVFEKMSQALEPTRKKKGISGNIRPRRVGGKRKIKLVKII